MSDVNSVYVVMRSCGEYSDRREGAVIAFHDEERAKAFVTRCDVEAKALQELRRVARDKYDETQDDADFDRYSNEANWPHPLDPDHDWYCGECSTYFYHEVPIGDGEAIT